MAGWPCAVEGVVIRADFWSGKRVFVTGHTGFKGGWLCLWLQSMGAETYGYSLEPPTEPNLFTVANVAAGMKAIAQTKARIRKSRLAELCGSLSANCADFLERKSPA